MKKTRTNKKKQEQECGSLIFGDGKNVILFSRDYMGNEFAYSLKFPLISRVDYYAPSPDPIYGFGRRTPVAWQPAISDTRVTVEMHVLPQNMSVMQGTNILSSVKYELIKNMSVSELFLAINKKISDRKI